MTTQWSRLVVTAVRYDPRHTHIDSVHVREYLGSSLTNPVIYTRQQILSLLDAGERIITALWSQQMNAWITSEEIRAFQGRYERFLRTDKDSMEADNLGELLEF